MLCWGSAYVPSAWLVEGVPPLTSAAARLGLAGLLLLGYLAVRRRSILPGVGWGVVVWLGFTQTAVFYGATYWGIDTEGAGLAAVLANIDPLFVAALSVPMLGERLTGRQWTGLALGFAGAAMAVSQRGLWPPQPSWGALVVVVGALAWGLGTITAVRQVRGTASPLALAGWQMLVGAVMLSAAGALEDGPRTTGAREVALVLVLAAIGSALPLALFYTALIEAPAGVVSAWFFLVPVVGVLTAWPLLGEAPSAVLMAGMAGVSVGLWLVLAVPTGSRLVRSEPDP
ncbi:MAG: DMT family transporter [Thermoleophilia bacterium]|nr:DMT family transporter [Thermoleophilia bacterium]